MLSKAQKREFKETGLLRLEGAVDDHSLARMRDRLWDFMALEHGFVRDAPATWEPGARPSGFQKLVKGDAFAKMASPAVCGAADAIMGEGSSAGAKHWGPPLINFPRPGAWAVPHSGWHMDSPAFGPVCWVLRAFLLLEPIAPRGGGTVVVRGSHHLARREAAQVERHHLRSADAKQALLKSEPWIRELLSADGDVDREHFLEPAEATDGTPIQVVELTGEAGDVILMDTCSLHAMAPNVRSTPRLVIGQALYRVLPR